MLYIHDEGLEEVPPRVDGDSFDTVVLFRNRITGLANLACYLNIQTLVLDNNHISSLNSLPLMPQLETLWLNNNKLDDLQHVLRSLRRKCPYLKHLSLLGNMCCSRYLFHKKSGAYASYRRTVVRQLPCLLSLDFEDVQACEKPEPTE